MADLDYTPSYETIETPDYHSWDSLLSMAGLEGDSNLSTAFERTIKNNIQSYCRNTLQDSHWNPLSNTKITQVTPPEFLAEHSMLGIQVEWERWHFFDYYAGRYLPGTNLAEAREYQESNPPETVENIIVGTRALRSLLDANAEDGMWNRYLEDDDRAAERFWEWSNLTPKELHMTVRRNMFDFINQGWLFTLPEELREDMLQAQQDFLEMSMGIWAENKFWSAEFYKTDQEISIYIKTLVWNMDSLDECLGYYKESQMKMFANRRPTGLNREAHKVFSQKLSEEIYQRITSEFMALDWESDNAKPSLKQQHIVATALDFARIITEKAGWNYMLNELRNTQMAEKICIEVLQRPGWVIDRLDQRHNLTFSDPVVGERSPQSITTALHNKLREIGIENPSSILHSGFQIDTSSIVGESSESTPQNYEEASLSQKKDISLMARILEKLNSSDFKQENITWLSPEELAEKVTGIGTEIYEESINAVKNAYDDAFSWWFTDYENTLDGMSDFITPEEKDAFILFKDLRGIGFWNTCDENMNFYAEAGKNVAIIVGTIALVAATTWGVWLVAGPYIAIAAGSVSGTAGNLAFLDPRDWDTFEEMAWDISSDLAVNTLHALVMERITIGAWANISRTRKISVFWWDLASWVHLEWVREDIITSWFRWEPLLWENGSKSITEEFNSHQIGMLHSSFSQYVWLDNQDDIETQNRLLALDEDFRDAIILYNAWHDTPVNFWDNTEFQTWYASNINMYQQVTPEWREELLDFIESWSIEQIEKYS